MLMMAAPAYAADHRAANAYDDNILFIAAPYLNASDIAGNAPTITIPRHAIASLSIQNISDYQWRISVISIPAYREKTAILQILDTAGPRLSAHGDLIVPLPGRAAPARCVDMMQQPLWLHTIRLGMSKFTWHAPALTPAAVARAMAEHKRRARLARRMADRAFYFGYDTNNDALK